MGTANPGEELPQGAKPRGNSNNNADSRRRMFPEVRRVPQTFPTLPPSSRNKQIKASRPEGAQAHPGLGPRSSAQDPAGSASASV